MKKFWKNFCLGAMAVTSIVGLSGCGKDNDEQSVDLDGDGVVSEWETLFENYAPSNRVTIANVVEINSLSDLKAINDSDEVRVYKLNSNIDCGGETLSINLGKSSLYGNNKVIKNFKLGDCAIFEEGTQTGVVAKGLFYNGVAVYDLMLFMGNQTYSLQDANAIYTISPFINVPVIDCVTVKGKIDVNRKYTNIDINLSLLASSIEGKRTDLSITNCSVIGDIKYVESESYSIVYAGGVVSKLWKDDLVYNCAVNGEIDVNGSMMNVGLIAGQNEGFVSSVYTKGTINAGYYSMGNSYIGGIVGCNEKSAEIKDARTKATLNFKQSIVLSGDDELAMGGIAGLNNGVISYTTSDANINVEKCDATLYTGSIAGRGESAIYYNVIGRGAINPKNCPHLFIADMVGHSKYGYFEKIISNTNINIDNREIDSKVNLGMLTIFENLSSGFDSEAKYNAEFTPNFKGILIGGKVNAYTKDALSTGDFKYNLGLRNEFEYYKIGEDGEIEQRPVYDEYNNPVLDENDNPVYENVTETLTPYLYSNLYKLDSYTINKYKVVEGADVLESDLKLTYAKDPQSKSPMVVSNSSSVVFQLNFFLRNLGFNYIIGNNEINISTFDISQFHFTLTNSAKLERYFRYDQKDYNGELSSYDKEFENACTFDINDEMFSYLNKLITMNVDNTYSAYSPLLISKTFATSMLKVDIPEDDDNLLDWDTEDGVIPDGGDSGAEETPEEDEDVDYLSVEERFAENIKQLLSLMKISAQDTKYTSDFKIISSESEDVELIKYIRINFSDNNYTYSFTFDVTEMSKDVEKLNDNYIVYMSYYKDKK